MTTGVTLPFVVLSERRHCKNRAGGTGTSPPLPGRIQGDHVASGVGASPLRDSVATAVSEDVVAFTAKSLQIAREPASTGREVKVPARYSGEARVTLSIHTSIDASDWAERVSRSTNESAYDAFARSATSPLRSRYRERGPTRTGDSDHSVIAPIVTAKDDVAFEAVVAPRSNVRTTPCDAPVVAGLVNVCETLAASSNGTSRRNFRSST